MSVFGVIQPEYEKIRTKLTRNTDTFQEVLAPEKTDILARNLCQKFNLEAVTQRSSLKKVFLVVSPNSQENTCTRVVFFFNKVAGVRPAILFKKRIWHRCCHVNFTKFLRTRFLTEHLRWLLLSIE